MVKLIIFDSLASLTSSRTVGNFLTKENFLPLFLLFLRPSLNCLGNFEFDNVTSGPVDDEPDETGLVFMGFCAGDGSWEVPGEVGIGIVGNTAGISVIGMVGTSIGIGPRDISPLLMDSSIRRS